MICIGSGRDIDLGPLGGGAGGRGAGHLRHGRHPPPRRRAHEPRPTGRSWTALARAPAGGGGRRDRPRLLLRPLAPRRRSGRPSAASCSCATPAASRWSATSATPTTTPPAILREEGVPARGGVIHCFTGGPDDARAYLDLGLHLSFSGILTFKKAERHPGGGRRWPRSTGCWSRPTRPTWPPSPTGASATSRPSCVQTLQAPGGGRSSCRSRSWPPPPPPTPARCSGSVDVADAVDADGAATLQSRAVAALPLVRVRLKYPDVETFVERFAPNVTRGGIFLASREPRPVGAVVRFEVSLLSGAAGAVGRGPGHLGQALQRQPSRPRPTAWACSSPQLDAASRAMLDRLLERREATGRRPSAAAARRSGRRPGSPTPSAARTSRVRPSSTTIDDTALRRALDRARVLADRPDDDAVERSWPACCRRAGRAGDPGPGAGRAAPVPGPRPRVSGLFRLPPEVAQAARRRRSNRRGRAPGRRRRRATSPPPAADRARPASDPDES